MTSKNIHSVAGIIAAKGKYVLCHSGCTEVNAYIFCCDYKADTKLWELLERALLDKFKEIYGKLPHCNNKSGSNSKIAISKKYFKSDDLHKIISNPQSAKS